MEENPVVVHKQGSNHRLVTAGNLVLRGLKSIREIHSLGSQKELSSPFVIEADGRFKVIDFSPTLRLAAVCTGNSVFLVDLLTGVEVKRFESSSRIGMPSAVFFSPSGRLIAVGYWDEIWVWRSSDGVLIKQFTLSEGKVVHLTWSVDEDFIDVGRKFANDGDDESSFTGGRISLDEGDVGLFVYDSLYVKSCISADNRYWFLISNDLDYCNCLLPLTDAVPNWENSISIDGLYGDFKAMIFSPDGRYLIGPSNETLEIWSTDTGQLVKRLAVSSSPILSCSFRDHPARVIIAQQDGMVSCWEFWNWALAWSRHVGECYKSKGSVVKFLSDVPALLLVNFSRLSRFDILTGDRIWKFGREFHAPNSSALSSDGRLLAITGSGRIVVWDLATRLPKHFLKTDQFAWQKSPVFDIEGRHLFTSDWVTAPGVGRKNRPPETIRKWSLHDDTEVFAIRSLSREEPTNNYPQFVFCDGDLSALVKSDESFLVFDPITGVERFKLAFPFPISLVSFAYPSTKGTHWLACFGSGIWVWEIDTRRFLGSFMHEIERTPITEILGADINLSSNVLNAVTDDGSVLTWSLQEVGKPACISKSNVVSQSRLHHARLNSQHDIWVGAYLDKGMKLNSITSNETRWSKVRKTFSDLGHFSAEGQFYITTELCDGATSIWNTLTGEFISCFAAGPDDARSNWVSWNSKGEWQGEGLILNSVLTAKTYLEPPSSVDSEGWLPRPLRLLELALKDV